MNLELLSHSVFVSTLILIQCVVSFWSASCYGRHAGISTTRIALSCGTDNEISFSRYQFCFHGFTSFSICSKSDLWYVIFLFQFYKLFGMVTVLYYFVIKYLIQFLGKGLFNSITPSGLNILTEESTSRIQLDLWTEIGDMRHVTAYNSLKISKFSVLFSWPEMYSKKILWLKICIFYSQQTQQNEHFQM